MTVSGYNHKACNSLHYQTIFRNPKEVKPYAVPTPDRCNVPAAAIHASSDMVVVVDMNAPAACVAQHKWQPNTPDGQGTPFLFQHGKAAGSAGTLLRMFKGPAGSDEDWHFPHAQAFVASGIRSTAIVSITCDREIITGGHADNSIRLISSDGAKTLETAFAHSAPVTSLGLSPDSNYLVTGSRDTTVLLWRIRRALVSSSSSISEPSSGTGTQPSTSSNSSSNLLTEKNRRYRIEGPIYVLRGHHSEIISCSVSSDLGIVVSCSAFSDVLLHSIRRGRLIRRLVGVKAHTVRLSSDGVVVTWNESEHTLSTFTLNGVLIAKRQLSSSSRISCIEIPVDGKRVLIGINPLENGGVYNNSWNLDDDDIDTGSEKSQEGNVINASSSICFLDLHTLELSLKVVDKMLKLGWEGDGLTPLIKS